MDFVVMVVVFGVFGLGLVLAFQGFIGKEINAEGQPFACRSTSTGPGCLILRNVTRCDCSSSASV